MRLRVLTFNIHGGLGTDGAFDYERLAAVIRAAEPDLVALQEVDQGTARSAGADQPALLAGLTGLHVAYGKAMDYDGGLYGEAILSRAPLSAERIHALPQWAPHEPRCLLATRVTPAGWPRPLAFLNTHLEHQDAPLRLAQAEAVAGIEAAEPAILCGDFNATPESEPMRAVLRGWTDATAAPGLLSFPATASTVKIDYVLFRPAGAFRVVSAETLDARASSDHRPVLAVLELAG